MSTTLHKLSIHGFKSIRSLGHFELRPINILIGANGAGKSNFIEAFHFLHEIIEENLQGYIKQIGNADALLYHGPKVTKEMEFMLELETAKYKVILKSNAQGDLYYGDESFYYDKIYLCRQPYKPKKSNHDDLSAALSSCIIYHFHDTSQLAGLRRPVEINQNQKLSADASNLAAYLYRIQLEWPAHYKNIRDYVRLAAPFIEDFVLRENPIRKNHIHLEWKQKNLDYIFNANHLSDGTMRFIALATALLQPSDLRPQIIIIDEPELGLHPSAIQFLAGMIKKARFDDPGQMQKHQIIISTQSPQLVSEFEPEDVVVVERKEGESVFQRLNTENLKEWLEDYSLGELWQKNIFGGKPQPELQELSQGAMTR